MQISFITILIILYTLIICRMVYKIIIDYDNNNPIKTVAWIFVVVLLPVLGLIIYSLLGRNLSKKRGYLQRLNKELKKNGYFEYGFRQQPIGNEICKEYKYLMALLRGLYPLPVFSGNKVDFFPNGKEKFTCLFEDIRTARDHIHILYYTIGNDRIGGEFRDLLIKKHREGVEVRLMYDDMGCNETAKSYFKQLKEAGIEVVIFNPINFPHFMRTVNYRNHKKIVVIDGHIGYTGGINVKDEYIDGLSWGPWTDVHLRIAGPAAQGLQTVFFIDWFYECSEYLFLEQYYPKVGNYGKSVIQVVTAEPIDTYHNIMIGMMEAISRARKSVYIETPYFVPSESILNAIQSISLSGIEVKIVMPDRSDNKKVQYAANSYVSQLLQSKVKVYRYEGGFIHSKLIVIDEELVIAGSSNMDIRSFELNFETNVFIYDKETAQKALEIIQRDMSQSKLVKLEEWEKRKPHTQFIESVYRLFSPLL